MDDLGELGRNRRTHSLTGGIGSDQLGIGFLDAQQFTHGLVIFRVGNSRLVEDVVLETPAIEVLAELVEPRANVLFGHR